MDPFFLWSIIVSSSRKFFISFYLSDDGFVGWYYTFEPQIMRVNNMVDNWQLIKLCHFEYSVKQLTILSIENP